MRTGRSPIHFILLALMAGLLVWAFYPFLWLTLAFPRSQEPDAGRLWRAAPLALAGYRAVPPLRAGEQRVLAVSRPGAQNGFERELSARGWMELKDRQLGSVTFWEAGPNVTRTSGTRPSGTRPQPKRLSMGCRRFSLWYEVCDVRGHQ